MTVDKTKARATNRNELVERTRDRIILEHTDLQITVINLENTQDGRKVQGLSQNRTLPQGMPVQEKDQESQSCPDTTP